MNRLPEGCFDSGPEITLPGIGEKITLPHGVGFRYDGEVPSLAANIARTQLAIAGILRPPEGLMDRILGPALDRIILMGAVGQVEEKMDLRTTLAYCYMHSLGRSSSCGYVIAKKRGLERSKSIFADGHESGELIQNLGQQAVLQRFLKEAGIDLDSSDFEGEDFADIGGMLALKHAADNWERGLHLPEFKTREGVKAAIVKSFGF